MKPRLLALALLAALAGGCAVPSLTLTQAEHRANDRVADLTQSIASRARTPAAVRELNEPYLEFKRVAATARRGDVNVKAASSPFGALLSEITRQAGYSLVLADSVDASRKVTVDFRNAQTEDAMRTTAFLAGYAAVIDRERRTVTVAETATYTFKLPAGVFSQLQAVYAAGGNATSASGGQRDGVHQRTRERPGTAARERLPQAREHRCDDAGRHRGCGGRGVAGQRVCLRD